MPQTVSRVTGGGGKVQEFEPWLGEPEGVATVVQAQRQAVSELCALQRV
jgi:hypothetical protein